MSAVLSRVWGWFISFFAANPGPVDRLPGRFLDNFANVL